MRRNPTPFILLTLCCWLCPAGQAADLPGELLPLMNVPDKVAYESDFSRQETIEKRKKGNWQARQGTRWEVEKNGDEFVVQFADGPTLYGRHRSLTESKTSGMSALNIAGPRGGVVEIDNVTLWTIKPENAPRWSTVRGGLLTTKPKPLPSKKNISKRRSTLSQKSTVKTEQHPETEQTPGPSRTQRLLASIKDPDYRGVLIAAHRGGYANDVADDAPENSVANVAVAVSRGYEVFETDIQRTSDGVFVMVHDPTLERETNGTGTVESKTLKELQQLRKRFRNGTLSNHKVATLTELLDAGNGQILFKPDLKQGIIDHFDQLARLISKHPAAKQIFLRTVMGNADAIAKCFASGTPRVEVMFKVKKASQVRKIHKLFSPVTIQIDIREGESLSESRLEAIRAARELGILVETHAYDSPEQTATLLDAGVRMLHTRKPDTIRKLLNARSSITEAADHVRDETTLTVGPG
jgi:glycerophosphoryl diester phosphodiesterase